MNVKKLLPLLSLVFLLTATPALAKQDIDDNSTQTQANCNQEAENHGQFISCVAQLHEGGHSVSIAAKSEIGKDRDDQDEELNEDEDDLSSPSVSPTPSVSPSASPSASPSPSVSPSPSPSASPSASPSPLLNVGTQINADTAGVIGKVIENLQNLIAQLQKLILQ